jgi:hypothetical protein
MPRNKIKHTDETAYAYLSSLTRVLLVLLIAIALICSRYFWVGVQRKIQTLISTGIFKHKVLKTPTNAGFCLFILSGNIKIQGTSSPGMCGVRSISSVNKAHLLRST